MLSRLRHVSAECREALERLSVVPSVVPAELAAALLGPALETLVEAEQAGLIEGRPGGLGFRHELARRAIEESLPVIRRRLLNQDVVRALRDGGNRARGCCTTRPRRATSRRCSRRARRRRARRPAPGRTARRSRTSRP